MQKVNYVDYKNSYCHYLAPKLKSIYFRACVENKPAGYIYKMITNIIKPAVWTEKDIEFRDNLRFMNDSKEMYRYCNNSVKQAENIWVYVDDNGDLIE